MKYFKDSPCIEINPDAFFYSITNKSEWVFGIINSYNIKSRDHINCTLSSGKRVRLKQSLAFNLNDLPLFFNGKTKKWFKQLMYENQTSIYYDMNNKNSADYINCLIPHGENIDKFYWYGFIANSEKQWLDPLWRKQVEIKLFL